MYRNKLGKLHKYHAQQLTPKYTRTSTETRQKHDIIIDKCNNLSKVNSLNYKIGKAWNELSFNTKDAYFKTIRGFTIHVKKGFLSNYKSICTIDSCYICNR